MREIKGNIWNYYREGLTTVPESWIVIPTNGTINSRGEAVMGRGLAKVFSLMFPEFPRKLGKHLAELGNIGRSWPIYGIYTFPVKHHYSEAASLHLIETSVLEIIKEFRVSPVYLPLVGCGNGKRKWEEVKPILSILPGNFIIVHPTEELKNAT